MLTPKFKHNCDGCRLFCVDSHGDWYVCQGGKGRSVICRHGDNDSEYRSGGIAECVQVTRIELAAFARGIELTPEEQKRTLAHLFDQLLGKLDQESFGFVMPDDVDPAWRGGDRA